MDLRGAWSLMAGLLTAGLATATPPPPSQLAADCDSPTYASDVLVCADTALLALDSSMRGALSAAGEAGLNPCGSLIETQEAWFRRRSLCAFTARHAQCLRAAYLDRLATLHALRASIAAQADVARNAACTGAPWGDGPVDLHFDGTGYVVVLSSSGAPLAVAAPQEPVDDWSPFLRIQVEADRFTLLPLVGMPLDCITTP